MGEADEMAILRLRFPDVDEWVIESYVGKTYGQLDDEEIHLEEEEVILMLRDHRGWSEARARACFDRAMSAPYTEPEKAGGET